LTFDGLTFGKELTNYQIISVPMALDRKGVKDVLEDDLGRSRRRRWRLYKWENNTPVEYRKGKGFKELEPGKGYLLIAKKPANVDTGPGTTLHEAPLTITLKRGWNLIGNPYNLVLSWEDIKKASCNLTGLDSLCVYKDGKYAASETLDRLGGGFIWSEYDEVPLTFPVRRNVTYNSPRLSFERVNKGHTPGAHLEVNFTLQSGGVTYDLAGLGMHSQADTGHDPLDKISMPQFPQFLQLIFPHPEHLAGSFTKDMVPVQEQYVWEFTVEANTDSPWAVLQWKTYFATAQDKQLLLCDIGAGRVVDMRQRDTHRFNLTKSKKFRVYYGPKGWLEQTLKPEKEGLLANFPNPFSDRTKLAFTLAERGTPYQVELEVYDLTARKIATLASGSYEAGFHEITWQGCSPAGTRVPAGVYLARLQVDGSRHYTIRLSVQ
jgi:hypothetical protein